MKTPASSWQEHRGEPSLNSNSTIINFGDNNTGVSFRFKEKINRHTSAAVKKDIEMMVLLKNQSSFWRTL